MQSTLMSDWSELPTDVLEHLAGFLSPLDYYRFGAVCQNWRAAAKQMRHPPRPLPWLVLGEDAATHKRKFFSLEENRQYLIDISELQGQRLCSSSYGWLFTLDIELNFRLLNPLTRKCYDLPPLPPYTETIRTYVTVRQSEGEFTYKDMQLYLVSKAILDHDPHCGSEFKVLMLYGNPRKLASWKLGDSAWTLIQGPINCLDDIIFLKDNFYGVGTVNNYNEIYRVDVGSDIEVTRVGPRVPLKGTFAYLVDYMGELLLVHRRRKFVKEWLLITTKIVVRKIDLEEKKYSVFKPEDGHAVFLGANSCRFFY